MKKIIVSYVSPFILGVTLLAITLCGLNSCAKSKHCTNPDYPYWCSSAKTCCSHPYHDGHGSCWETMSGCRSSGYACETCHLED